MKTYTRSKETLLQVQQFCQNYVVPMERLSGAKVNIYADIAPWMNDFEVRIVAYLAEHVVVDKKVKFPTTWIDALLDRFLPTSLRRYFTIKYTVVEVKASELASKWKLPDNYGSIPFMTWNETTCEE